MMQTENLQSLENASGKLLLVYLMRLPGSKELVAMRPLGPRAIVPCPSRRASFEEKNDQRNTSYCADTVAKTT